MRRKRIVVTVGVAVVALALTGAGVAYASGQDGNGCGAPTQLTRAVGPAGTASTDGSQASADGPACVPAVPVVPTK